MQQQVGSITGLHKTGGFKWVGGVDRAAMRESIQTRDGVTVERTRAGTGIWVKTDEGMTFITQTRLRRMARGDD